VTDPIVVLMVATVLVSVMSLAVRAAIRWYGTPAWAHTHPDSLQTPRIGCDHFEFQPVNP
jgi:hypothetical protein